MWIPPSAIIQGLKKAGQLLAEAERKAKEAKEADEEAGRKRRLQAAAEAQVRADAIDRRRREAASYISNLPEPERIALATAARAPEPAVMQAAVLSATDLAGLGARIPRAPGLLSWLASLPSARESWWDWASSCPDQVRDALVTFLEHVPEAGDLSARLVACARLCDQLLAAHAQLSPPALEPFQMLARLPPAMLDGLRVMTAGSADPGARAAMGFLLAGDQILAVRTEIESLRSAVAGLRGLSPKDFDALQRLSKPTLTLLADLLPVVRSTGGASWEAQATPEPDFWDGTI